MRLRELLQRAESDPSRNSPSRAAQFEDIDITPTLQHAGIRADEKLRRFVDLPKFLDLVNNRRLLMPQMAKLVESDPFECHTRPNYDGIKNEDLIGRSLDLKWHAPQFCEMVRVWRIDGIPPERGFKEKLEKMSRPELEQASWYIEYERLKRELICSCWHVGDSASEDAMWKIYCNGIGVAITTSVDRLKSSMRCRVPRLFQDDLTLTLARVQYTDKLDCNSVEPWLVKRTAFSHEHEARLYLDYPLACAPGFELNVDPHVLIESVTVNPYSEKWQIKSIEETIEILLKAGAWKKLSHDGPKITRSKHLTAPLTAWPGSDVRP